MPYWLSDPALSTYLTLMLLGIIVGAIWLRVRKRWAAITASVFLVLLLGWFICDRLVESPREEAVRRVEEMSKAFAAKDWGMLSEHVSNSFSSGLDNKSLKKESMKGGFDLAVRVGAKVTVWNFDRDLVKYLPDGTGVEIAFNAKAEAPGGTIPVHILAVFVRDPDGKYRLFSFKLKEFINQQADFSMPIPGVP